ncbi:hypothetical protein AB0J71_19750 [Nonomuraea sp. NPDC049637]|uniref:hypothetical protein n=1 Tax=Nonomuraea sp. NPDC049637 TaxID=3154356 RepID=UPI00343D069E
MTGTAVSGPEAVVEVPTVRLAGGGVAARAATGTGTSPVRAASRCGHHGHPDSHPHDAGPAVVRSAAAYRPDGRARPYLTAYGPAGRGGSSSPGS